MFLTVLKYWLCTLGITEKWVWCFSMLDSGLVLCHPYRQLSIDIQKEHLKTRVGVDLLRG